MVDATESAPAVDEIAALGNRSTSYATAVSAPAPDGGASVRLSNLHLDTPIVQVAIAPGGAAGVAVTMATTVTTKEANPYDDANMLSRWTFHWMVRFRHVPRPASLSTPLPWKPK